MFIEVLLITLVYLQTLTRVANDSYPKTIEFLYHFTNYQRNLISLRKMSK